MIPWSEIGQWRQVPLWVAPALGVALAFVLGAGALFIDSLVTWEQLPIPLFAGHPDTARTLLSAIAGSAATLIALIFTIIAVVIQLASSQYSPRALYTLLQDRPTHVTIGVFVGTFSYAVVVLVGLRLTLTDAEELATGLAITLAFGLAVVSLVTFAIYANHIIHSVRITSILNRLGDEARQAIDRLYPDDGTDDGDPPPPPDERPDLIVSATRPGVVLGVDGDALLRGAIDHDCVIVLLPAPGTFVPEGAPLLAIHGRLDGADELRRHVEIGRERTVERDLSWAFQQLTDVALRGLSPGINDPATAVQVLDQHHDLLRRLMPRDLSYRTRLRENGRVRVYLPETRWEDVLIGTIDEIRLAGRASLQVHRRIRQILEDLLSVAPRGRRASLQRRLELLDAAAERGFEDPSVRDIARQADSKGTQF